MTRSADTHRDPTIRDVAARAGTSIATVSKYINGAQRFTEIVEDRIRRAIRDLGYPAGLKKRGAGSGGAKMIGVIVFKFENPLFSVVFKGMSRVALDHGYGLMLLEGSETLSSDQERQLDTLSHSVQGFLVTCRVSRAYMSYIQRFGKPTMFFGGGGRPDLPSVGSDGYRAARLLGELLVDQGHARIVYVGVPASPWNHKRHVGLAHFLDERDLPFRYFEIPDVTAEAVEDIGEALWAAQPDGIVCYNDVLALMVMKELARRGIAVPRDVSVVGIDNVSCGRYSSPTLTTVDVQAERYGELGLQLLLRQIHEGMAQEGHVLLEPRLVLRESTRRR